MTSHASLSGACGHRFVRAGVVLLCTCFVLGSPMVALGQTATIYRAWWTNPVDSDHDGCVESAQLNWDPDVSNPYMSLSVFEKIFYRPVGSSFWTLRVQTAPHTIVGMLETDIQSLVLEGAGACAGYDYKIEIYREGEGVADYTRDPSNQSALGNHREESPPPPPPTIITTPSELTILEGEQGTFDVRLDSAPESAVTVTVSRYIMNGGSILINGGSSASLAFDALNYATPQTVTLEVLAGSVQNGDISTIMRCTATGLTTKDVSVKLQDVDAPPLILTNVDTVTVPSGGTATFGVNLDRKPQCCSVTVAVEPVSGGDPHISVTAGMLLVFDPSSWSKDSYQDVTLTSDGLNPFDCSVPLQAAIRCAVSPAGTPFKDVVATEPSSVNCGPCVATRTFYPDDGSFTPPPPDTAPADCYFPGWPVWVMIDVNPNRQTSSFAVEDIVPTGWVIVDTTISSGGVPGGEGSAPNSVRWFKMRPDLNTPLEPTTLRYCVIPPADAVDCQSFGGSLSCDSTTLSIGGVGGLCMCATHPADLDSPRWAISAIELGQYATAWIAGSEWSVEPESIPANYVTQAACLYLHGEAYSFDGELTAPACWGSVSDPTSCGGAAANNMPIEGGMAGPTVQQTSEKPFGAITMGSGTATRTLPNLYEPGVAVHVSIAASPTSALMYIVEDIPPAGWAVDNVSEGGSWDQSTKKVKWVYFDSTPRTLAYDATPPAGESGTKTFQGYVFPDGTQIATGGQATIIRGTAADFDSDGDVDLADFGHLQSCFNGPNHAPAWTGCDDADLDGDTDVDLADFGALRACFNGPNRPYACE